jgi:hypothetical protein
MRSIGYTEKFSPDVEQMALQIIDEQSREEVISSFLDPEVNRELAEVANVYFDIVQEGIMEKRTVLHSYGRTLSLADRFYGKLIWSAAAVAASAFLGFVIIEYNYHQNKAAVSDLAVKGASDRMHVAVQRGAARFRLKPNDTLMTNDALGFFYSAKQKGYLAIFNVDNNNIVTPLFPLNQQQSCMIDKGRKHFINSGAKVTGGTGCEWLVAVFSDMALNINTIAGELKRQKNAARQCDIQLKVKNARTVYLLPVKR